MYLFEVVQARRLNMVLYEYDIFYYKEAKERDT